jgi:hypothetical protein
VRGGKRPWELPPNLGTNDMGLKFIMGFFPDATVAAPDPTNALERPHLTPDIHRNKKI